LAASGTREVLVAVDVGTSSTRVRLLAPDGAEVDAAACQTRVVADTPGFAELDADALWGDVARLIGGLVRESLAVRGVGVTAQLGTMLLDERGVRRHGRSSGPIRGHAPRRRSSLGVSAASPCALPAAA
jgi:glycerol kinase